MESGSLRAQVDLLKALGHPVRLRILSMLRDGELCVCQVQAVVGLATSTVSEHLRALRHAGLLEERKDGRWVYYALDPQEGLAAVLDGLWPRLDQDRQVRRDRAATRKLRKVPVEITCARSKSCDGPART